MVKGTTAGAIAPHAPIHHNHQLGRIAERL